MLLSVFLYLVEAENLYPFNIKNLHYNNIDTEVEVGCAGMPFKIKSWHDPISNSSIEERDQEINHQL